MNLDTRLKEILKDGVYFDHLDCSDECGNKDGELTAVDNIVAEIKAAVLESLPAENPHTPSAKAHFDNSDHDHPCCERVASWNRCLKAVKERLK